MPPEPTKVERIFGEALKIESPSERAAYLDEACAGDAGLRQRVEALLKSHFEAGGFLESPVLDPDATALAPELTEGPGTTIGKYKLLQLIGEGGFGVVYMAEQSEPVRRNVALKIIKLGMDTKQVIARFEAERQALAMMDHPNIARVFDAGATDTGRPYFVMELVKGVPITEYADQNKLSTQARLELFIQVCRAIQHAHQKGVIHRDIKPNNVLVTLHDSTPVPKVIDFGIAKATSHRLTEKTLFTEFRQFIGTPEYMSPDQAAISGLDVDTRTDIYSLGVLLYELLTGSTPFDATTLRKASYAEIMRVIREVEPPRPSVRVDTLMQEDTAIAPLHRTVPASFSKIMRGDLDWIVMKAMDKDRTRRYETASEFVGDVQRYLNNDQVLATPPTLAYKMQKFVRRNRVGVLAGLAVAMALVIGLSAATYGLLQARQEANRSQRIADFLGELFLSTDPDQAMRSGADVEHVLATAREVFGEDHATVAATLSSRALQLQSAGELEAAERHYRESLRIWREAEGDDTVNVADAYRALGLLSSTMGDYSSAEVSFREAIRITRSLDKNTLTLAETLSYLADAVSNRGEYMEAVGLLQEAVEIRRAVAPHQKLQLALTVSALTNLVAVSGVNDEAVDAALREVIAAWRDALPPDGPIMGRILTDCSLWYLRQQRLEEAEELLNEGLKIFRALPEPPPRDHFINLRGKIAVHQQRSEQNDVIPLLIEAVEVASRMEELDSPGDCESGSATDEMICDLADECWGMVKNAGEPRASYEVALDGLQAYLKHRPDRAAVINSLGVAHYRLGNFEETLKTLAVSDSIYSAERGGVPQDVAFIAMAHHQLGQHVLANMAMGRLDSLMMKPAHAIDHDCKAAFDEATALIGSKATEGAGQ